MTPEKVKAVDKFGRLPDELDSRWGSFGVSVLSNVVILILVVLLGAAVHKVQVQKAEVQKKTRIQNSVQVSTHSTPSRYVSYLIATLATVTVFAGLSAVRRIREAKSQEMRLNRLVASSFEETMTWYKRSLSFTLSAEEEAKYRQWRVRINKRICGGDRGT